MAYQSKTNTRDGIKPIGSNLYGTCSTGASTSEKVVSMPDFNVLTVGVTIHVQFTNANTASNPTLAVGSTVATPIKRNGSLEGEWQAGSVISFTYDGVNWVQNDADDGDETSYGLAYDDTTNTLFIVEDGGSASVTLEDAITYTLSISGHTVTLTGSDGSTSTVTVPDNDTKYGISISGNTLSIVEGGSGTSVTIPNDNTTYDLSISGNTLTLTGSDGTTDDVTLPDNDTKYGLSISGHTVSLVEGGSTTQVTVPDENTTYTISISGNTITLTGSDGSTSTVTVSTTDTTYALSKSGNTITLTGSDGSTTSVTDSDTTYALSISGHTVTLTGSDGSTDSVTVPDDNTTYTLSISGHTLTLTPSSGTAQSVTVPDNNTTYTISNNGSTITLTPSSGTAQSITVPNDNTTYSFSLSGHTLTITPSSGSPQTITLPDNNTTYSISKSGSTITLTGSDGSTTTVTDSDTTYSAGTGLSLSGTTFNHSNAVTAKTTKSLLKVAYDDQGHITDSEEVVKNDITRLGIPGSDTNNRRVFYGTCSTAAGTAAKEVTLANTTGWELLPGTVVGVKFTNSNTASNVTLNVNGTGAKQIWYNTAVYTANWNAVCGYANRTIFYMYDGTYWVFLSDGLADMNETDRLRWGLPVKASAAISAGRIIVGDANGYKQIASGVAFDISYPILYAASAISSGGTNSNVWRSFTNWETGVNFANNGTIQDGTANKVIWLKGTLNGNTFTIASSNWLTCTVPTSEDGFYYIPLGVLKNGSTTNGGFFSSDAVYAYTNGAFRQWVYSSGGGGTPQGIKVTVPTFSSLPQTVTDSRITSGMECVNAILSNSSAQVNDWTVTTTDGSLTISGTISGSTTATLYMFNFT